MRKPIVGEVWIDRGEAVVLMIENGSNIDHKLIENKDKELRDNGVNGHATLAWDYPRNYDDNGINWGNHRYDLIKLVELGEDDWSDE